MSLLSRSSQFSEEAECISSVLLIQWRELSERAEPSSVGAPRKDWPLAWQGRAASQRGWSLDRLLKETEQPKHRDGESHFKWRKQPRKSRECERAQWGGGQVRNSARGGEAAHEATTVSAARKAGETQLTTGWSNTRTSRVRLVNTTVLSSD